MSPKNSLIHPILLFDGVCNFCNGTVQWIIKRDPQGIIHFASLQSGFAREKLQKLGLESEALASVVLIIGDEYYTQSEAILQVLNKIKPGGFLFTSLSLFPKFLRNWGYRLIAKNRYRIFGKREHCMVPQAEWRNRFPDTPPL
jgi:predicted DCC family thiol-disulfide oxidoreductase YuxK